MINPLDAASIIKASGYAGIFGVIFAETGLLIGFFLPGDSLLFTAGFLASTGYLNITIVLIIAFGAAVIGDTTGYFIGQKYGPAVFNREGARFFKKEYIVRANLFYEKHGGKALVLGRFLPIVRTAVPILAGVGKMRYRDFFLYNVVGGFIWTIGLGLMGYFFGRIIPNADKYVLPIILVIVLISVLPSAIHVIRQYSRK